MLPLSSSRSSFFSSGSFNLCLRLLPRLSVSYNFPSVFGLKNKLNSYIRITWTKFCLQDVHIRVYYFKHINHDEFAGNLWLKLRNNMGRFEWKIIADHFKSGRKWAELAQDSFPAAFCVNVEEFLAYISNHYILKYHALETKSSATSLACITQWEIINTHRLLWETKPVVLFTECIYELVTFLNSYC